MSSRLVIDENQAERLLPYLQRGCSNAQMAKELGYAEDTIKSYLRLLYKWLGASNRAQAVAIGLKKGYITHGDGMAIAITDEAIAHLARVITRDKPGGHTLNPGMHYATAERYLTEVTPYLRIIDTDSHSQCETGTDEHSVRG